jgi:hypothetical protein
MRIILIVGNILLNLVSLSK